METEKMSHKDIGGLLAIGGLIFVAVALETSLNVAFPTLAKDFSTNVSTVSWLTTAYLLTLSIVVPLSSYLNKAFSTKRLFIFSNIFFLIATLLAGWASSFPLLIVLRVLQAIGAGIALPLIFNYVAEITPFKLLGLMMGIANLIISIAPALGPTYGGVVLSNISWQAIFRIACIVPIITLFLGAKCLKSEKAPISKPKFHFGSWLILSIFLITLVLGLEELVKAPVVAILLIIISVAFLIIFIKHSQKLATPLLDLTLFKNQHFLKNSIGFFVIQLTMLALNVLLPTYVQQSLHYSAQISGLVILPGALLSAFLAPLSGRLLDKQGPKLTISVGSILNFISLGLMAIALFFNVFNIVLLLIFYVLYMIGIGLSFSNVRTLSTMKLDKDKQADANALLTTGQQLMGAIGTVFVSAILAIITSINVSSLVIVVIFAIMLLAIAIPIITQFKKA
ncbi:DHA2 family efflux MFS transporter permease subunit [Lactiplantibacillus plantarum]|uniref:DHA2 family efflux MFS transporter permease subunit n=1 Tax=Lactiplantibacillus plantarum TaxID=1590 RepID=UPI0021A7CDB7|nr:DHA2 family efflux MFS transporter permease subunit [Lactiplantibacillus plantarum]MCT3234894.1 DHA2 family efflux MFS transporter permease subunit [Lactiplantibacillus plantarum]